jgi:tRNA pseudouridine13 synthase
MHETGDEVDPLEPELDTFVESAAYMTADVPGVGGRLRDEPEDFFVEELPLYEPCGTGEHLYLFVEKRNMSTVHMIRLLANHFGVDEDAVGYAGLKDKRAVTRQLVSIQIPGKKATDFPEFQHERIKVLWSDLHTNKLRQGHLAGNRFVVRIRGADATKAIFAHRVLQRFEHLGVPNRAGEQRFGHLGNNHLVARHWVRGEYQEAVDELLGPTKRRAESQDGARRLYAEGKLEESLAALPRGAETERRVLRALIRSKNAKRALYAVSHMQRRYFVTALQSAVFNAVLDRRAREGMLTSLMEGDLAWKHDNGAVFAVTPDTLADPTTAERLQRLEISPSGPMWGLEMTQAGGGVGEAELQALDAAGLSLGMLREFGALYKDDIPGKRRPLRVPLMYPAVEGVSDERGHSIKCTFELPAGSFATVVLREIMKPAPAQ